MITKFLKAFLGGNPKTWPQENSPVYIENENISLRAIPFGAAIQDIRLVGFDFPLVLGFENPDDYQDHSPYFGATAGRYANRIKNGRFELDGETIQLDQNFLDKHHLHGGKQGIGKKIWKIESTSRNSVIFSYQAEDGEMGYPGAMTIQAVYEIEEPAIVRITYIATTTKPTLCNLAHHSYFNLDGSDDISHHHLHIPASQYLPVDSELIPTGERASVRDTPFDFQQMKQISFSDHKYDHNYCVFEEQSTELRPLARLKSDLSGISLEISSTEPGVQFYDGAKINTAINGLQGKPYKANAGMCLEPQLWPDSPNNPDFAQAVLRPGETYRQVTELRFRARCGKADTGFPQ